MAKNEDNTQWSAPHCSGTNAIALRTGIRPAFAVEDAFTGETDRLSVDVVEVFVSFSGRQLDWVEIGDTPSP